MNKAIFRLMTICFFGMTAASFYAQGKKAEPPRVFLADAERLRDIRQSVQAKDKTYEAAVDKIETEARKALKEGTYSVTSKSVVPPSGDKHDYMSQAPYFWPDPTKKDGLPYIRKDEERNPEINKITDHTTMDKMHAAVKNLHLADSFA